MNIGISMNGRKKLQKAGFKYFDDSPKRIVIKIPNYKIEKVTDAGVQTERLTKLKDEEPKNIVKKIENSRIPVSYVREFDMFADYKKKNSNTISLQKIKSKSYKSSYVAESLKKADLSSGYLADKYIATRIFSIPGKYKQIITHLDSLLSNKLIN